MQFEKIAPYLKEPLVLIGFFLFLGFSFCRYLVKQRVIPPLPPGPGFKILKTILLYGFIIGLIVCALGFILKYREQQAQERSQRETIQAQREAEAARTAETRRKDDADLADRQEQEKQARQRDVEQQQAQVKRLQTEVQTNLAVAEQLRRNSLLMLERFDSLSEIVRTPGIKILPILFPSKNLDLKVPDNQVTHLADDAMDQLGQSGLLKDELEVNKITAAAMAISQTIQTTISTVRSLQDPSRVRYKVSDAEWRSDQATISKVVVADVTPFQTSYSNLELVRTNYEIVAQHFVEYLLALQDFFDPSKHLITRGSLRKVLVTERQTKSLLVTYGLSLANEMRQLKNLSDTMQGSVNAPVTIAASSKNR